MRVTRLGHWVFAVSFAGLGVLSLGSGDFALVWQPVPAWVPGRTYLAYASGLVLFAAGIGMLVERTARLATLVMTVNLLLWLLLLRLPRVAMHPTSEGMWLGFGETLVLVVGGWLLLAAQDDGREAKPDSGLRAPRMLYGIALPLIGLSHFVYASDTAALVPAWLPWRMGFAYLGGAGHIAAGLGILFAVFPRLAATLEAAMLSLFTLLVWVPPAAAAPASRFQWTALLVSAAMTGAAWAVAGSLQGAAWGQVGWTSRRVVAAQDEGKAAAV